MPSSSYNFHLDGWNTIQPHFQFDNYYLQKILFSNFLHFAIFCTFLGWFSGFESYNNHLGWWLVEILKSAKIAKLH